MTSSSSPVQYIFQRSDTILGAAFDFLFDIYGIELAHTDMKHGEKGEKVLMNKLFRSSV